MMKSRREKRIVSLMDVLVGGEYMVCPHIREIFYSASIQQNDIKPSRATSLEEFEKLSINAIEGIDVKKEDVRATVLSMPSGVTLRNWTVTDIPTVFHLSQ